MEHSSGAAAEDGAILDVHVITSSRDLDDYDIVSTKTLSVAVPNRTTESFRKLIWAAMASRATRCAPAPEAG